MDRIERAGAAEHRRRLVEEAGGEVLEIGAGTGKNLPLYRVAERVVALDPDPVMRARAHDAARETRVPVEVVEGDAAGPDRVAIMDDHGPVLALDTPTTLKRLLGVDAEGCAGNAYAVKLCSADRRLGRRIGIGW